MCIRKKVTFSFILILFFIAILGFITIITTYQLKENKSFQDKILTLINIQDNMNLLINKANSENNNIKLEVIKNRFEEFELKFEKLKESIEESNSNSFIDLFTASVRNNILIREPIKELYSNEHEIETIFELMYIFQQEKLLLIKSFNEYYSLEKNKRKQLQNLIYDSRNIDIIKSFANLNYFSKETLYQYSNTKSLDKWLDSISFLENDSFIVNNKALAYLLKEYKDISIIIGNTSIELKNVQIKEKELVDKLSKLIMSNKDKSIKIENLIEKESLESLDLYSIIEIIVLLFIIVLSLVIIVFIPLELNKIVSKLHNGVNRVKDGDYDISIFIKEDEEFNDIAHTFNSMAKNIKENKEELESKIKQRTKELESALDNVNEQKNILENLSNKLSKYLSPQVFESIFSGRQDVKLESKREYLTVFFSDIKNFTEITDNVEIEVLTELLNEYLEEMSKIVIAYGGTIDKYIGDCIMVFFGAPTSEGKKEDALKCAKMALEMKKKMSHLRTMWQKKGIDKTFSIRMGINSGYCTVGNFGSKNRLDYTIIGGVVNLASRLESLSKENEILISKESYLLVKDDIKCIKKDKVNVKGISNEIQTYEIVDDKSSNSLLDEREGFLLEVDYNEIDKEELIKILEERVSVLRK